MALEQIDLAGGALPPLTANGSTAWVKVTGTMRNPSKGVHVRVTGDLGGGTLTIEGSNDQTNAYGTGAAGVLVVTDSAEVRLLAGEFIRVTLTGATAPSIAAFVLLPGTEV